MHILKKCTIILTLLFILSGCATVKPVQTKLEDSVPQVQKKLFDLTSFKADIDIAVFSNKNTTHYNAVQYYSATDKYRLEVIFPEFLKGLTTLTNGKNVWVYNPNTSDNNLFFTDNFDTNNISYTFIPRFFSNYIKSGNSKSEVKNQQIILSAPIVDGNKYLFSQRLTVDKNAIPQMLELFDSNGNQKIQIIYKEFVPNIKLDDIMFEKSAI